MTNHVVHAADPDQRTDQRGSDIHRRCAVRQRLAAIGPVRQNQRALDQIGVTGRHPKPGAGDRGIGVFGECLARRASSAAAPSTPARPSKPSRTASRPTSAAARARSSADQRLQQRAVEYRRALQHIGCARKRVPESAGCDRRAVGAQHVAEQPVIAIPNTLLVKRNQEEIARSADTLPASARSHRVRGWCRVGRRRTGRAPTIPPGTWRWRRRGGQYLFDEVVGDQVVTPGQAPRGRRRRAAPCRPAPHPPPIPRRCRRRQRTVASSRGPLTESKTACGLGTRRAATRVDPDLDDTSLQPGVAPDRRRKRAPTDQGEGRRRRRSVDQGAQGVDRVGGGQLVCVVEHDDQRPAVLECLGPARAPDG